jgi:hypothetical protein
MNTFEYFSEIEERFTARRGSLLMLSTLDWALIETWREAGVPLAAVLRGIDAAFDGYDARAARGKGRLRKVNGLAWCAQAVMQATEEMVEAATGAPVARPRPTAAESGFEHERVAAYLERNAEMLSAGAAAGLIAEQVAETARRLRELAAAMLAESAMGLDELDRALTVMEERLVAALRMAVPESAMIDVRAQAESALAPYRAKMSSAQAKQVIAQFEQKTLLEMYTLPRLSLFYMGHE